MEPVTITESAKDYLIKQCESSGERSVKLSVLGGGCAGFSYDYSFCEFPEDDDYVIQLDEKHNFIIDGIGIMYVIGTELDYVQNLGGSALQLTNPNATSSCGCGASFAV